MYVSTDFPGYSFKGNTCTDTLTTPVRASACLVSAKCDSSLFQQIWEKVDIPVGIHRPHLLSPKNHLLAWPPFDLWWRTACRQTGGGLGNLSLLCVAIFVWTLSWTCSLCLLMDSKTLTGRRHSSCLLVMYLSTPTAGLPISETHTKNKFANKPEGLRHFWDHRWKALSEGN